MPQFDPTFFAPQLFWLVVTFVILYFLLSRIAMPKIGDVLEERQRKIDDNLDKATRLKAEAEKAIATYEKALADSRAKAHEILRENATQLSKQAEQWRKELGDRLAIQIKDSETHIAAVKEQALANVRDIALDVAKSTTAKLTGITLKDETVTTVVTSVIQEGR